MACRIRKPSQNPFLRSTQYPYIHMRFPCITIRPYISDEAVGLDLSIGDVPGHRSPMAARPRLPNAAAFGNAFPDPLHPIARAVGAPHVHLPAEASCNSRVGVSTSHILIDSAIAPMGTIGRCRGADGVSTPTSGSHFSPRENSDRKRQWCAGHSTKSNG